MMLKTSVRVFSAALVFAMPAAAWFGPDVEAEVIPPMGTPFVLPDDMRADFHDDLPHDIRFTVGDASTQGVVNFGVRFATDGSTGTIVVESFYKGPTSFVDSRLDTFTTSFAPTAICATSGLANSFLVAGWNARRRAVVERWTVDQLAVGEALSPQGGGPVPVLSTVQFAREEIWFESGVEARPIEAMSCDALAQKLYVLEYGPEAALSFIDLSNPEDQSLHRVADVSTYPELAEVKAIRTGYHDDHGLVLILWGVRAWQPALLQSIRLFRDTDGDLHPDFDALDTLTWSQYQSLFPYQSWRKQW